MDFLSFVDIGLGIYNGLDLIRFEDTTTQVTLTFRHHHEVSITDDDLMTYVRAYGQERLFFKLGSVHYNPLFVSHVAIDVEAPLAQITDDNGDVTEHSDPLDIQALQDAAGAYLWQPLQQPYTAERGRWQRPT